MILGGCAAGQVHPIAGTATDHPHIVSQAEFLRTLRGNGAPTVNYQTAYRYAADACATIMKSRWQDREQLSALLPASIQDPTIRYEVYVAVHHSCVV
jgi:hypothetical protein